MMNKLPPQIQRSHASLGITEEILHDCKLPLCLEPQQLVDAELDYYARPQRLTPACLVAWTAMKQAAQVDGVTIFLISAFRSLEYQHDLIAKKLAQGLTIEEILKVNAAPGFSEHHTGRAIDIGTLNCPALVEEFENTAAFQWLIGNADEYEFSLSYPRDNALGISYEPWHWCFKNS